MRGLAALEPAGTAGARSVPIVMTSVFISYPAVDTRCIHRPGLKAGVVEEPQKSRRLSSRADAIGSVSLRHQRSSLPHTRSLLFAPAKDLPPGRGGTAEAHAGFHPQHRAGSRDVPSSHLNVSAGSAQRHRARSGELRGYTRRPQEFDRPPDGVARSGDSPETTPGPHQQRI